MNNPQDNKPTVSPLKTEEIGLPGYASIKKKELENYVVRYLKANIDEPEQRAALESIETRGIRGEEVVIIQRQTFTFTSSMFVVLTYLEKIGL